MEGSSTPSMASSSTSASSPSSSTSSSSSHPSSLPNDDSLIEVTLRLAASSSSSESKSGSPPPISKRVLVGLPDLAVAAPRALLLVSSRNALPSSYSCHYGKIVVEGLVEEGLDRAKNSEDDENEEGKKDEVPAHAPTAPQRIEPQLAFKFSGKDEEGVFGRSLNPIEVITYAKDSQPILTLIILNTCLGQWATPQVASKLATFLADNGAEQLVLASALHFNPPPKFESKVHYIALYGASRTSLFADEQSPQELIDFAPETPVRQSFLSAMTLFLRVENIPTHCLLVKGYRVSRISDKVSDESVRSLVAVLAKLLPGCQPDLGLLQSLEPHEIPIPGPNPLDMRMYT